MSRHGFACDAACICGKGRATPRRLRVAYAMMIAAVMLLSALGLSQCQPF